MYLKQINTIFILILLLFIVFIFSVDVSGEVDRSNMHINNTLSLSTTLNIFINNILAVIVYLIPILGIGKLILDLYVTAISLKIFLLDNSTLSLMTLFLPHFFIELYAMSIWVWLSIKLLKDFATSNTINNENINKDYKTYMLWVLISIFLILIAAIIETLERWFI